MEYLIIIAGFALLVFGANWLVDGAVGIARHHKIPNLIIGLTIVAFGTSTPELVVNLFAAADPATSDIALTNIIGSNTINVYIILGLSALVCPIVSQATSRKFDIPLSIAAPLMVLLLVWCFGGSLTRMGGIILLVIFTGFMYMMVRQTKRTAAPDAWDAEKNARLRKKIWYYLMVAGGLLLLVAGGQLIVRNATAIAESLGVSQAVIGLTIVALGTSLPELATSVVAAFKKNSDIALGNVIGSNIFNVFFVLGTSAVINPLPAYPGMTVDLLFATLAGLLVLVFVVTNKKHEIKRWEGLLLICIYIAYLVWIIGQNAG